MPGLVPGIHALSWFKTWMAGTSPAMTVGLFEVLSNEHECPPEGFGKDRRETRGLHRLPAEDDRHSERHRRRSENPEVPCGLSGGHRARRRHVGDEFGRAAKTSRLPPGCQGL